MFTIALILRSLFPGMKGFADAAFASVPSKLTVSRSAHSDEMKEFISRAKARVESFNGRMKRFRVLSTRFRHGKGTKQKMELHKACAEAVCVIVHYGMENGSPLFEM